MVFPLLDSLWEGSASLNIEGVSARDRNRNDGNGLWFSRYSTIVFQVPYTFAVTIDTVDSVDSVGTQPINFIIGIEDIETTIVFVEQDTALWRKGMVWLGAQPLRHYGLSYTFVTQWDSTPPFSARALKPTFTTGARSDRVDYFTQDYDALPDYTEWGWKYKGWMVLPHYNSVVMTTKWLMTPPAWRYKSHNFNWLPGDTGVLFTTGTFARIDTTDDSNPYKLDGPIPPYPGEDFLNSTALQAAFGINSIEIMPFGFGNEGTIFISLEPENRLTDTTNFPLILMTKTLPFSRDSIVAGTVQLGMQNRSSTLDNDPLAPGFPQIDVAIKRF